MQKYQATGCRCSLGESPIHVIPPVENAVCAAFKEYEDLPKMVPLDFTEDDGTWITSKLSGAAGALGAEVIKVRNWLL